MTSLGPHLVTHGIDKVIMTLKDGQTLEDGLCEKFSLEPGTFIVQAYNKLFEEYVNMDLSDKLEPHSKLQVMIRHQLEIPSATNIEDSKDVLTPPRKRYETSYLLILSNLYNYCLFVFAVNQWPFFFRQKTDCWKSGSESSSSNSDDKVHASSKAAKIMYVYNLLT